MKRDPVVVLESRRYLVVHVDFLVLPLPRSFEGKVADVLRPLQGHRHFALAEGVPTLVERFDIEPFSDFSAK